jgi:hypothetical protein
VIYANCSIRKHAKVSDTSYNYLPLEDAEIAAAKKEWENLVLSDIEDE